ncbi:Hsp20/alpha crystallin family protein [Methanogenium cariaci]|uniref:Hsp20/alpha crystallin family protein n=1 Tax=Methanogenium cariaci TaxID=2197 RepID=UPI0012F65CDB|nr:Hsp20/alpha crystallin family protein [Methanogenium cariaci]
MTKEQDERVNQFTELMRRLFEETMNTSEMLTGEINIIIAAACLPKSMETETRTERRDPNIREPVFERHEHQDCVTITTELPGTVSEEISYTLDGEVITLSARAGGDITYRAAYPAEGAMQKSLAHTFKNGVIELTYKKNKIIPKKGLLIPTAEMRPDHGK